MIMREIPADDGEIILAKGKTIGYLAQHQALLSGNTIYQEVESAKADLIQMETQLRLRRRNAEKMGKNLMTFAYLSQIKCDL